ncbi:hypothetical protein OROGR_010150 [Orobanche gracilis]
MGSGQAVAPMDAPIRYPMENEARTGQIPRTRPIAIPIKDASNERKSCEF